MGAAAGLQWAIASGALALLYAVYLNRKVVKQDPGDEKMREIAKDPA